MNRFRSYRMRLDASFATVLCAAALCLATDAAILRIASAASAHFSTLPPHAVLPGGARCASEIPATPETMPANAAFNRILPSAAQLSSYAANRYTFSTMTDYSAYQAVDGRYTGSTDMIMRWAACKWGIDEDVVRAQAWQESHWLQGGHGDKRTSQSECVRPGFTALWDTTIVEPDGAAVSCPGCCYQSWSAWQTKVFYEWMTWPAIMQSTAFAADYRFADTRACMNGAYARYFDGRAPINGHSYAGDLANYARNPTPASLDTILWGCIGMHFSGGWYDPAALRYIGETKNWLATKPWPK